MAVAVSFPNKAFVFVNEKSAKRAFAAMAGSIRLIQENLHSCMCYFSKTKDKAAKKYEAMFFC